MSDKKLVSIDNLDKLSKGLDTRYKEIIQNETERALIQEQLLEAELNATKDMLGGRSIRYITQADYDQLSDAEKNSNTVVYFITDAEDVSHEHENKEFLDNLAARNIAIGNKVQTFDGTNDLSYSISDIGAAPASHTHDDRYYTETEANSKFAPKSHNHDDYATANALSTEVGKLNTAISKKSDSGHTHDNYLTELDVEKDFEEIGTSISNINTQITGLQTSLAGKSDKTHNHNDDYAPKSHNHDDIYYTDDEVDNLLASKSDSGHNHNDKYYTESEIDKKITDLQAEINADVEVEKDRAEAAEAALQAAIDKKSDSGHNHDDRYYTESEMNTKLAAKADTNHGTHVPAPQTANNAKFLRNDNSWQTVTPANIGAAPSSHNHDDSYYTKTEINTEIDTINSTINTKEAALQTSINGKAPSSHTHDDKYYTETEMDGKLKTITDSISSNVSTLNSSIATAKSSAISESKSYTNTAIANLVDSAPEAMNTLNELAEAISNHKDDYEAYVSTVSSNIATAKAEAIAEAAKKDTALHTTISAEIDADVKVEKDRAEAAESALQAAINKKSDDGHTHDGRYYTESEINTKLAGKANSSHGNHVPATQTASNKTFLRNDNTWATVTPANIGAAPSSHTHDDSYYTKTNIDTKIEDINNAINTKEAALNSAIGGKAPKNHTHTVLTMKNDNFKKNSDLPSSYERGETLFFVNSPTAEEKEKFNGLTYGLVQTLKEYSSGSAAWQFLYPYNASNDKFYVRNAQYNTDSWRSWAEVYTSLNKPTPADIGAAASSHTHDDRYYTESEMNTKLSGKSDTGHVHDDRYYTETEINGKIEDINETINTNVAKLTTEVNKKLNKTDHGAHLALGTTSSTAFRGDYGNTAYNHSQAAHAPVNAQKNSDITKSEIEAKLTGSITSHNHNGQYYTETEINGKIEDINDTINTKEAALQASIDGKAPSSHNHTSVNRTRITTPIYNATLGVLVDFNINVKSGAMVILKLYGNSYSTNPPIEAIYQFYDYAGGDIQNCTGSAISGPSITLKVYKADGKLKAWFQQPSQYCTFKLEVAYGNNSSTPNVTLSNAAEPTTNITQTVTITPDRVYSAKYKPSLSDIGAAPSSHGTHVTYATAAPSAAGTASAGSSSSVARADHVHPAQTTISGNAGSATKLATGKAIKLSGLLSGQATFDGTADATITVSNAKPPKSGDWWSGGLSLVSTDGVMEVGKYLDFHNTDASTNDYDVRLQANTSTPCIITLPTSTGTLALKSDKPSEAGVADSVKQSLTVQLNGGTKEGTNKFTFNGATAKSVNITPSSIGASASGHTHDDRYYTETEINDKIEDINETITAKEATLQANINGKANSSHGSHVAYGTCATAAATAAKVVSVSDTSWKLTTGCIVAIKFTTSNTAGNVTLNVNSTGAYPIWYNNAAYTGNGNKYTGYANRVLIYMFNGTHWVWISGGTDDNSTYTNASLGQGYATCDTAAATVEKVGTLSNYGLTAGGVVSVKFTYAVPASATLNINSKGAKAIYFRGAAITANIIKAGDIATFMYNGSQYQLISIDRWQNDITSHTHDGRYYTEAEINDKITTINNTIDSKEAALNTAIGKKSDSGHTHNQINSRGNVTAETANNRPAVGGLSMSCAYSNGYPTNYGNVMTMKGTGDGQLLIGWSGTSGAHAPAYIRSRRDTTDANWSEWAQIYTTANKPSCNDIGAAPKDNTIKTVSVSGGKLTLTKDKRQKCTNIASGTQIVFPSVGNTEFLEIHLYFNSESDMSLVLPDNCKWRVDPNLEAGKSYELVATWNTMNWLANLIVYS